MCPFSGGGGVYEKCNPFMKDEERMKNAIFLEEEGCMKNASLYHATYKD